MSISLPCSRAPAGFDAIAQAAGGVIEKEIWKETANQPLGRVYIFDTEAPPPPGLLRSAVQSARELVAQHPDPLEPSARRGGGGGGGILPIILLVAKRPTRMGQT